MLITPLRYASIDTPFAFAIDDADAIIIFCRFLPRCRRASFFFAISLPLPLMLIFFDFHYARLHMLAAFLLLMLLRYDVAARLLLLFAITPCVAACRHLMIFCHTMPPLIFATDFLRLMLMRHCLRHFLRAFQMPRMLLLISPLSPLPRAFER